MKTGFDRLRSSDHLRGMAVAGIMGIGALGGGSVRATTTATTSKKTVTTVAVSITRSVPVNTGVGTVDKKIGYWYGIGNITPSWDNINTSNGFTYVATAPKQAFGITSAASLVYTAGSFSGKSTAHLTAYWDNLAMAVDGELFVNPTGKIHITTDTLTGQDFLVASDKALFIRDVAMGTGIEASVEYFFHPTRMTVRAIYTVKNTTNQPLDTSVLVVGALGTLDNTTVQYSSDGNTTFDAGELWFAVSDRALGVEPDQLPAVTQSIMGQDALLQPTHALLPDSNAGHYGFRYDLSLEPLDVKRIMVFSALNSSNAGALSAGMDFTTLGAAQAAGLLERMEPGVLGTVVNYNSQDGDGDGIFNTDDNCVALANADQSDVDADGIGDVCDSVDDRDTGGGGSGSSGGGAFGIPSLLTLLAGLGFSRRRIRR